MGHDANIFFRAKPGFQVSDFEDSLPAGFDLIPISDYEREERLPDATHQLETVERLYEEGYERGSWPIICAAVMTLLATENVERVWYGDDQSIPAELTQARVLELCAHYMTHGHRPSKQFRREASAWLTARIESINCPPDH